MHQKTNISKHDMENFRLKLAAILLDSPFNTCKYEEEKIKEEEEEEEEEGDPNDCVIIDKNEQEVHGSLSQIPMTYEEITYTLQEYFMQITDDKALRYDTNVTTHTKRKYYGYNCAFINNIFKFNCLMQYMSYTGKNGCKALLYTI
jgi:hypothetical protein